jgi:heme/copper-type cytochrome/quinol oxidase subunit 3
MRTSLEGTGFTAPADHNLGEERGTVAVASLIASLVLALSTIIAATAVTVGMARAAAVDSVIDNEGTLFAIALLLGLLFIGISSITLLPPRGPRHRH